MSYQWIRLLDVTRLSKPFLISFKGADIVVTSCPACMIQLNNQLKGDVTVAHIAEFIYTA